MSANTLVPCPLLKQLRGPGELKDPATHVSSLQSIPGHLCHLPTSRADTFRRAREEAPQRVLGGAQPPLQGLPLLLLPSQGLLGLLPVHLAGAELLLGSQVKPLLLLELFLTLSQCFPGLLQVPFLLPQLS